MGEARPGRRGGEERKEKRRTKSKGNAASTAHNSFNIMEADEAAAPPLPPSAFSCPAAVLLLPRGPASPFFYGRAVLPGPALITLFAAQQAEQNDCIYLGGAGEVAYDVGLLSEGGRAECVLGGAMAAGGSLVRLRAGGGSEPGGAAAPPPHEQQPTLAFEPRSLAEGAAAAPAAAKYFPEVVEAAAEAARADFLVVWGELRVEGAAWRPRFEGAGGGAPSDTVAALLARGGGGCGGC